MIGTYGSYGKAGNKEMVGTYLNYLIRLYAAAQKVFDDDLDSSDALVISKETTVGYKDWQGYEELLGPHGAQAYAEVEEAAF